MSHAQIVLSSNRPVSPSRHLRRRSARGLEIGDDAEYLTGRLLDRTILRPCSLNLGLASARAVFARSHCVLFVPRRGLRIPVLHIDKSRERIQGIIGIIRIATHISWLFAFRAHLHVVISHVRSFRFAISCQMCLPANDAGAADTLHTFLRVFMKLNSDAVRICNPYLP